MWNSIRNLPLVCRLMAALGLIGTTGAVHALQASDPVSRQTETTFIGYETCRLAAASEASEIDECASNAIEAAAKRLSSAKSSPETIAAAKAFSEALPALGDIAILGLGQGEDSATGRIIASDAAVALADARADLLSGVTTAPNASFALFAARKGMEANTLAQARALWAKSRITACAAYPVANCAVRYDGLLGVFARKAGLTAVPALARPAPLRPKAKAAVRRKK